MRLLQPALLAFLMSSAPATAATLAIDTVGPTGFGVAPGTDITYSLYLRQPPPVNQSDISTYFPGDPASMLELVYQANIDGTTGAITSSFSDLVRGNQILTDGVNGVVYTEASAAGNSGGNITLEAGYFADDSVPNGVDLAGFAITGFFLDNIVVGPSGQLPQSLSATFRIEGDVSLIPLPASGLLLVGSLAGLAAFRHRHKAVRSRA